MVIAGGREVVALSSWQCCSSDSLGEEAVQLEGEATFQFKQTTGMGFQLCPQNRVLLRSGSLKQEATLVLNWTALWAHTPWPCGGHCVSGVCLHVSRGHWESLAPHANPKKRAHRLLKKANV